MVTANTFPQFCMNELAYGAQWGVMWLFACSYGVLTFGGIGVQSHSACVLAAFAHTLVVFVLVP